MRRISIFLFSCLLALCSLNYAQASDTQADNLFPRVKFVTSHGDMVVELNRMRAPYTVENFLQYVVSCSYNNTLFHRVIDEFVVQGGGFDAEWNELPTGETIVNESGNGLKNRFGTIAMARQSDPHSAIRQFYFNANDNDSLNPSARRWGYTVFGEVVENAELLRTLAAVPTGFHEPTQYENVPLAPLLLLRVELLPAEF
ncbi:peptidylprolyl isomerase [Aliidiomarina taiwanensis]|uniref:Peptidyl-prolyl cis-trans isomerase n=1 Tax=Aliidiomarina taiwanensis TaxID=946228 RepID=A0A432X242_9GAMM|nr:peptidylprolyl isomerase [Aliidiomarina taiwanensis]RUO40609.1 peptidylprolyl isomerase [Aliidiomarina taiwanensis]